MAGNQCNRRRLGTMRHAMREDALHEGKTTADRVTAFSDAVFAVIVTIMVLELKAPINRHFQLSGLYGPRRSAMR